MKENKWGASWVRQQQPVTDWLVLSAQVRRNMSNISCDDIGRVILQDIAPRSVSRCEIKAGAALQAVSRAHFLHMEHDVTSSLDAGHFTQCFYSYRQDSTNTKRKRSVLELESAYLAGVALRPTDQPISWASDAVTIKQLSDTLQIQDETAAGILGFTIKALASLGCPNWDKIRLWNLKPVVIVLALNACLTFDTPPLHRAWWF